MHVLVSIQAAFSTRPPSISNLYFMKTHAIFCMKMEELHFWNIYLFIMVVNFKQSHIDHVDLLHDTDPLFCFIVGNENK